jgi:DNA-binding NtrC family response regulator
VAASRAIRVDARTVHQGFEEGGAIRADAGAMESSTEPITPRIAIAEDDAGFRKALAARLRTAGYMVTEAHDGAELLHLLQSTPAGFFQLVITDQRMPRMYGLEILARAGARAPFVIVTGVEDAAFHAAAARFGAAAILRKPVDLEVLLDVVQDFVAVLPALRQGTAAAGISTAPDDGAMRPSATASIALTSSDDAGGE